MKNQPIINNNNFSVYVSEILNNLQQLMGNINRSPKDYKLVINERALKCLGSCALKKDNNIYVGGEMIDIDGECGGYNIGIAFLSGLYIGEVI